MCTLELWRCWRKTWNVHELLDLSRDDGDYVCSIGQGGVRDKQADSHGLVPWITWNVFPLIHLNQSEKQGIRQIYFTTDISYSRR